MHVLTRLCDIESPLTGHNTTFILLTDDKADSINSGLKKDYKIIDFMRNLR